MYRWTLTKPGYSLERLQRFVKNYKIKHDERHILSPQDTQQVIFGTLILWVSWLFFNGGSSQGIVGYKGVQAKHAVVNTILAPAVAGITTLVAKTFICKPVKQ